MPRRRIPLTPTLGAVVVVALALLVVWVVVRPASPATGTPRSGSFPAGIPTFVDSPAIPGFGPTGSTERGTVVRIVDGDTIHAMVDGVRLKIRYIGMDTPESVKLGSPVEPFALAASEANKQLVDGREVVLERDVSQVDRFGRSLRYIWLERPDGWMLVNLELVRLGFASPATFPPDVKYVQLFTEAQRAAMDAGRGSWAATP